MLRENSHQSIYRSPQNAIGPKMRLGCGHPRASASEPVAGLVIESELFGEGKVCCYLHCRLAGFRTNVQKKSRCWCRFGKRPLL